MPSGILDKTNNGNNSLCSKDVGALWGGFSIIFLFYYILLPNMNIYRKHPINLIKLIEKSFVFAIKI